jgi:DNA (cytosine-5)-methyltransferase 1
VNHEAVDLFAGPGGWDIAAAALGLHVTGIEFDSAACETRQAVGLHTIRGDVRAYGPADFPEARGLIASPPCQTFSMAGKGAGRKALDQVLGLVESMAMGLRPDVESLSDERTGLVLEPLRWVLDAVRSGRPYGWLAFEQVSTVLPVWQAMAEVLRGVGYRVAVRNLHAEQYGVPQTRKRAVLVARYGRPVSLPTPTHSKFHTRDKSRLDPGVRPWVSMAAALGWDCSDSVGFPRLADAAESVTLDGVDYRARDLRSASDPSWVVTEKARSWNRWQLATGTRERATQRTLGEPSPTLAFGHDAGSHVWTPVGMSPADVVQWKLMGAGAGHRDGQQPRESSEPGHTITGKGTAAWVFERPSTTIVGSFRPDIVAAPGYRVSAADGSRQNAPGSVRVSLEVAAALQSFPPRYPWQGGKTKRFQQVGNAIPPLLALHVLRSVL